MRLIFESTDVEQIFSISFKIISASYESGVTNSDENDNDLRFV